MKTKVFFNLMILLVVVACGQNRRPGLSDKELFAQKETTDTLRQELVDFDAKTYIVPPGIKYTESRAVDPANPPIVIDIEKALQRGAENISLSSIGKSVKYIKVTIPKDMHFFDFMIRDDTLFVWGSISGTNVQCILPFTLDGKFMNFVWEVTPKGITKKNHPDIEEEVLLPPEPKTEAKTNNRPPPPPSFSGAPNRSQGEEIIYSDQVKFDFAGKNVQYTITRYQDFKNPEYEKHVYSSINGELKATRYNKREESYNNTYFMPSIGWIYVYRTLDLWFKKSPWNLITFSTRGDTLCRFENYNKVTPTNLSAGYSKESITSYFYNDLLTFRTDYADTIFRLAAPNKIIPAYAINSGKYKLYAVEGLRGQIENKVYIENIRETQDFLFISINSPERKNHVLLFNKRQKILHLHENEKFANNIDNGPAFYPDKIMSDGKTMACWFTSSYFQNHPSTTINNLFPSMAKNSVIFMIIQ